MIATCSGCPRRWRSTSEAHCGSCHKHWRNVSGFDAHRRNGTCVIPDGYEQSDGVWATREGHLAAERAREVLESARQRGTQQ